MRLPGAHPAAHLTYCSNIHPGESWAELDAQLRRSIPKVRDQLGTEHPFGLGLRLSADAATQLRQPDTWDRFAAWMEQTQTYVFTLNGFPYGPFHGTPVKEAVYRPDWSQPERLRYTSDLIEILARCVGTDAPGSISTVPCGFRRDASASAPAVAEHLLRSAAQLWQLRSERGVDIALGLEPEPECRLETTAEAIAFFETHLLSAAPCQRFAQLSGCGRSEAEAALRRHLGVCFDTCHAAVEFEDPRGGPRSLATAGIRIVKAQITAGLELASPSEAAMQRLEAFADAVYLHQVVVQTGPEARTRYLDLPEAITAFRDGTAPPGPWRVHFHVPVFASLEAPLRSTRGFITEALPALRSQTAHFEVETYTWGVLPQAQRQLPLERAIAQELQWVLHQWNQA